MAPAQRPDPSGNPLGGASRPWSGWLLYLAWLNGAGPPRAVEGRAPLPAAAVAARLERLVEGRASASPLSLMAMIGLLAFMWILIGAPERPPDLSRISLDRLSRLDRRHGRAGQRRHRGSGVSRLYAARAGAVRLGDGDPRHRFGLRPGPRRPRAGALCSSSARASSSPGSSTGCSPVTPARSCRACSSISSATSPSPISVCSAATGGC